MQVGVAATGVGAQQVQRRRRLAVSFQQPLGIGRAGGGVELLAVDDVPAIGRQGDAPDRFGLLRARLGELAGDAPNLDHGLAAGKGQHHRHLQDQAKGVPDGVGVKLLEALRAVATLQQKGVATRDRAQQGLKPARLTGEHQRRHGPQPVLSVRQRVRVRIVERHVFGRL